MNLKTPSILNIYESKIGIENKKEIRILEKIVLNILLNFTFEI